SGVFSGTVENFHFSSSGSRDVTQVRNFLGSGDEPNRFHASVAREYVNDVRLRIVRASRPVRSAGRGAKGKRAQRAFELAFGGWGINRAEMIVRSDFSRFFAEGRRE